MKKLREGNILYGGLKWSKNVEGYYRSTTTPRVKLHRFIYEEYYGKTPRRYCIHHKDENRLNNNINNLEKMTRPKHQSLHNAINPRVGFRHTPEAIEKTRQAHIGTHHTAKTKKRMSIARKRYWKLKKSQHPAKTL